MSEAFEHRPVMVDEVVELFRPVPPGVVVDATVGGGGHARALLEARPTSGLSASTVTAGAGRGGREPWPRSAAGVVLRRARFDEITDRRRGLQELGHETTCGSAVRPGGQLPAARPARAGLQLPGDGPLDMRMDRSRRPSPRPTSSTATPRSSWLACSSSYGGERFARRIAAAIVAARPLTTTGELVDVIRAAIPAPPAAGAGTPPSARSRRSASR